ncbi:MAG: metallophosphoesterase, partial [Planctomycetota bacterium]|nr:metallophosphoesterase [Planctomycetota bacterium]
TKAEVSEGRGDKQRSWAWWDFLGELPDSVCDDLALFVHGSPRDPVREYLLPSDARNGIKMQACFEALAGFERRLCFIGHSHVPAVYGQDGTVLRPRGHGETVAVNDEARGGVIVNVGSTGQPRDGDTRLSLVLFDGETVTFARLEYDHDRTAEEIRSTPGLPDYLAERLTVGR